MKNKAQGRWLAGLALMTGLMGAGPMLSGSHLSEADRVAAQAFTGGGKRRRRKPRRVVRKRSLFSARLLWDPRPTSGGRNYAWKALHAASMHEAHRLRREGGKPAPHFIYDENFRNIGIQYAA